MWRDLLRYRPENSPCRALEYDNLINQKGSRTPRDEAILQRRKRPCLVDRVVLALSRMRRRNGLQVVREFEWAQHFGDASVCRRVLAVLALPLEPLQI